MFTTGGVMNTIRNSTTSSIETISHVAYFDPGIPLTSHRATIPSGS
jgi:hypothetical protein